MITTSGMPIYEYQCEVCGIFEAMQKASEAPLNAQPECPHKNCPHSAQRLISPSAFHLKGGGWYKTDYASSSSSAGGKKTSSEPATTETPKAEASAEKTSSEKKTLAKVKGGGGCGSGCGCH